MYDQIVTFVVRIQSAVWGIPLIVLLLLTGVLLTVRLRLIQVFMLPKALLSVFQNEEGVPGEISSSKSLCTALAATVGTGNIVGVATALVSGGPGALFWMWVAAFFGMATKYAEAVLAVKYRIIKPDGTILGGPFYYIEQGLGRRWKFLAVLFAFFCAGGGLLGIGTLSQIQSITSSVQNFFDPGRIHLFTVGPFEVTQAEAVAGLLLTIVAAGIILGGLKRIAFVAQIIVPLMICIYLIMTLTVLILHFDRLPETFLLVIRSAFNPKAVTGGVIGSIFIAMQYGIARGIFSNESGLGSAPIVAAAAKTSNPVRQGLVSMTGTFIDTIIICTMTGMTILTLSGWNCGLDGIVLTADAFTKGLTFLPNGWVNGILMVCMVFFAFTTTLGWNYYGERSLDYLVSGRKGWILAYRWLYILAIFSAPYLTLKLVWTIADVMNGLMAFPNLAALVFLSGVVVKETRRYLPLYQKNSGRNNSEDQAA